jgi:hypothetical protein
MLAAPYVTQVERVVVQQPAAVFGHLLPSAPTLCEGEPHLKGTPSGLGVAAEHQLSRDPLCLLI